MEDIKKKAGYIAVTGIIRGKDGRYLICKRGPQEKAFPNKWCVPGGKLELDDFIGSPKDTSDHWLDIFERVLRKEIMEETGLEIENIGYVSSLVFIRPNGFMTVIVSLCAEHAGGEVRLQKSELTDFAWVTLEQAKHYDLIENIFEQIQKVESMRMPQAQKSI